MHILMPIFNAVGKGTYWRAVGYAQELAKAGHAVTVMASAKEPEQAPSAGLVDGFELFTSSGKLPGVGYDPVEVQQRLTFLKGRRYDLIHSFETRPTTLVPALAMKQKTKAPLIVDWCDWFGKGGSVEERPFPARSFLRPLETFFEERFRGVADGTTVINTILQKKAIQLGVSPQNILLLSNGTETKHFTPRDKQAARQRLGLPLQAPILCYTGAIFKRDAELMARAFNLIVAKRPSARLLLVGYFNVDMTPWLVNPEAVIVTGSVSYRDLADYVASADVGWLPLVNSGANQGRLPLKTHDFMSAGVPLAVTDVGDMGRLAVERGAGIMFADQAEIVARETLDLLDNVVLRERLGANGRQFVTQHLTWQHVTEELLAFYQRYLPS